MLDTRPQLIKTDFPFPAINRKPLETLQVNLGYKCNLSCTHCHVNAGPTRSEQMDAATVELVLDYIDSHPIKTLDLTGGAPELNPHFKHLVSRARATGMEVIDRCNLTILGEPGMEDMAEFLSAEGVTITASLPCYLEQNVEKQRGKGVYWESIAALQKFNQLGYGRDKNKQLNLVFNPDGLNLPPSQLELEQDYKQELQARHGIVFNQLFTITNMPISRFGSMLLAKGLYKQYMATLRDSYRAENLDTVMCRNLLSIDYQGYVYDCDFNQMLKLPLASNGKPKTHLTDLLSQDLLDNPIITGEHCFGCTAGQGSSCGGALEN
ncbi:MAG: arsenosugar biosynthesis radical SAM protein ArsS [Gammaproteobacteria bacterium]|jgi:radical SAM/Cys-rich protein|nr:arsenosugar biosynthesis radical SAM protein ArsS [Gammaproteobacteria bacterium]MDP6731976.1 arsenosugar biosynthesis radical SAM protein ArsS [Gammaproteobacteria bacterium]